MIIALYNNWQLNRLIQSGDIDVHLFHSLCVVSMGNLDYWMEQSLLAVSVSGQFCVVNIVETGNFP